MPMVRISCEGMTNLRMYGSKRPMRRNAHFAKAEYVRWSKTRFYETPYSVTGTIKHTGSK